MIEEYAPVPPSGRGSLKKTLKLDDILGKLKPFSVRKPVAFIAGSLAVHGESNNDIDIIVRGEDWSDEQKKAFDFRIYRMFADILNVPYDEVPKYVNITYSNQGPFTSYLPIYEETFIPIEDPKIVKMSEVDADIANSEIKFKEFTLGNIEYIREKGKSGRRIIAGYASIPVIDRANELIPKETLEKALKKFIENEEYANLMLTHNSIQIGKVIKKYGKFTTHVDDTGLFIVAEIRKDLDIANDIWQQILNGEINSFSIGFEFEPDSVVVECDGKKCWKEIKDIKIFEISLTDSPANFPSSLSVIAKSSSLEVKEGEMKMSENVEENIEVENKEVEKNPEPTENKENTESEISTEEKAENPYPYPYPENPYPYPYPVNPEDKVKAIITALAELATHEGWKDTIKKVMDMLKKLVETKEDKKPDEECEDEEETNEEMKSETKGENITNEETKEQEVISTHVDERISEIKSILTEIKESLEALKNINNEVAPVSTETNETETKETENKSDEESKPTENEEVEVKEENTNKKIEDKVDVKSLETKKKIFTTISTKEENSKKHVIGKSSDGFYFIVK